MAPGLLARLFALTSLLFALDASASSVRSFSAARRNSQLARRGLNFEPGLDGHVLFFRDDSSRQSAARVVLSPKYPTLILDDVHDHMRDVTCSASGMTVHFHTEEAMYAAAASWSTETDLVLFTSHLTCAPVGEHKAYMVEYVISDKSSRTITFNARRQTMKDVTHRIHVELGDHLLTHLQPESELETVGRLAQRQASSSDVTTLPSTTSYNLQTATLSPTVNFSFVPPTATATAASTTGNVAFSAINRTVLPPDSFIQQLFPGASALADVQLGCNNCTMTGSVSLEAAGFDVNSTDLDGAIDFFNTGFFRFSTEGLAAHIELGLDLLPGFSLPDFYADLAKIPLDAIVVSGSGEYWEGGRGSNIPQIKDVITLGPVLDITIPIALTLNSSVNITTGFDLAVPDNSQIILNVSEISGSSQTGFDKTKITVLPFSANADNLSFNLTVGLRPKLTLSAGLGGAPFDASVDGGVGAFLDLPKVVATIDPLNDVNSTCDGPIGNSMSNHAVRVTPHIVFDVGLDWELDFKVATIDQDREGAQVLVSKTFDLPSQCLIFDPKSSSLVPANESSSSGGQTTMHNAAAGHGISTILSCAVLLLAAAIAFAAL